MSLTELQNAVLLLSNPAWSAKTVPTTVIRNLTALSSQIAYEEHLTSNLTTLTVNGAETRDGTIKGLLYVPDISIMASCNAQQYDFIPRNVTHRRQLPTNIKDIIAIAPWFSIDCTQAYLSAVRPDNVRAFIFYKPNNSTNKPQDADSPVWNLDDNGAWRKYSGFPIFAIPGLEGQKMMTQLSLYSGPISKVPHGQEINQLYGPNPNDFVRIVTSLKMKDKKGSSIALWIYFLIVIGVLLFVVLSVSFTMHFIQRRRRRSLKRRVKSGEVDLEAMGVKRLTVPATHVESFPIYTYNAEPDLVTASETLPATGDSAAPLGRGSRKSRRHGTRPAASEMVSQRSMQTRRSIRSKRSNLAGRTDTTATNFQPNCHICLVAFEHRTSVIRELPCGHIFHPSCIDEFLTQNSSLCPVCKQCMLPRGYCPRITNGMVRRERAVRRLRERVDLDDLSLESGEPKFKEWSKRLFSSSAAITTTSSSDVPMTPIKPTRSARETGQQANLALSAGSDTHVDTAPSDSGFESNPSSKTIADAENSPSPLPSQKPASKPTNKRKSRKTRPRELRLLPTQPENDELPVANAKGRGSPSSFARERMREIAAHNAPFDDPDHERKPQWRRAISKAFPGFF